MPPGGAVRWAHAGHLGNESDDDTTEHVDRVAAVGDLVRLREHICARVAHDEHIPARDGGVWRLHKGENAVVVAVDADGDLALRNGDGIISSWANADHYRFQDGGRCLRAAEVADVAPPAPAAPAPTLAPPAEPPAPLPDPPPVPTPAPRQAVHYPAEEQPEAGGRGAIRARADLLQDAADSGGANHVFAHSPASDRAPADTAEELSPVEASYARAGDFQPVEELLRQQRQAAAGREFTVCRGPGGVSGLFVRLGTTVEVIAGGAAAAAGLATGMRVTSVGGRRVESREQLQSLLRAAGPEYTVTAVRPPGWDPGDSSPPPAQRSPLRRSHQPVARSPPSGSPMRAQRLRDYDAARGSPGRSPARSPPLPAHPPRYTTSI
eukprot:TRINITY_DN9972_c0_g1_i2.p1 TRINITY_DN9972_c0_g1~~TRINITY_DN9972_c0_g1_i2.p1  ORF type:complete len:403 (+),score=82.86 TRINITY_DN9972_c0_g1_i2:70-1209(+)